MAFQICRKTFLPREICCDFFKPVKLLLELLKNKYNWRQSIFFGRRTWIFWRDAIFLVFWLLCRGHFKRKRTCTESSVTHGFLSLLLDLILISWCTWVHNLGGRLFVQPKFYIKLNSVDDTTNGKCRLQTLVHSVFWEGNAVFLSTIALRW